MEGWAGLCLPTEPVLGRVISAGDAGLGPQLSSDPRSQKVIVRWLPGPPHRLLLFLLADTPTLLLLGPECLLPGPQLRHRELREGTAVTLQEQLQGQTTLPEAAAPAVSLHLSQISGNVHTLQSGKTRDNAWLRKARQYTALVIVRSPGEPLGGSFLQKNMESHAVGAEPLGDDKILALPCVHDTGESPRLDSHCQVLNFIIHATFKLTLELLSTQKTVHMCGRTALEHK